MNNKRKIILKKDDLLKFRDDLSTVLSDNSMLSLKGGDYQELSYTQSPYDNYAENSYGNTGVYLNYPG